MTKAPCGGCPPCCEKCIFSSSGEKMLSETLLVADQATYGCVRRHGDIVTCRGKLGQLRDGKFHPITNEGVQHLLVSGNPLAEFVD